MMKANRLIFSLFLGILVSQTGSALADSDTFHCKGVKQTKGTITLVRNVAAGYLLVSGTMESGPFVGALQCKSEWNGANSADTVDYYSAICASGNTTNEIDVTRSGRSRIVSVHTYDADSGLSDAERVDNYFECSQ